MNRFAARSTPDENQAEVSSWYNELWCSVVDLHGVGFGCPDILVGTAGINDLVEIKTIHGQLEPKQIRFIRDWRGSKVVIVKTKADVINHVLNMRERAATKWGNNGKK